MELSIVDVIKSEGVKKEFSFFEDIQNKVIEFYGEKIRIIKPVKVEGYVINYEGKLELNINIETEISRSCSRCLCLYEEKVNLSAKYVFVKGNDKTPGDEYLLKEDIICLDELVVDEITSQMAMKPLCKPDCKGLCPKCGKNKNFDECNCKVDEIDPRLQKLGSFFEKK